MDSKLKKSTPRPPPSTPPPPFLSKSNQKSKSIGDSLNNSCTFDNNINNLSRPNSPKLSNNEDSDAKEELFDWINNPTFDNTNMEFDKCRKDITKDIIAPGLPKDNEDIDHNDDIDNSDDEPFDKENEQSAMWTDNPTYSSPSNKKIKINLVKVASSVPCSPRTKKKYKIKVQENQQQKQPNTSGGKSLLP